MKFELNWKQNSSTQTSIHTIKPKFKNILDIIKEQAVNDIGIEQIFDLEWENKELIYEPSFKIKRITITIER
tara:strand:+ start:285 stop:500 length:216 start_codon:yes stop_codon:yes gene_type:complete